MGPCLGRSFLLSSWPFGFVCGRGDWKTCPEGWPGLVACWSGGSKGKKRGGRWGRLEAEDGSCAGLHPACPLCGLRNVTPGNQGPCRGAQVQLPGILEWQSP